ncbi:Myb family DNA-binding protein [Entamoeba marina]
MENQYNDQPNQWETDTMLSNISSEIIEVPSFAKKHGIRCQPNRKKREKWTREESERFDEALKNFGRDWKKVSNYIGTKTVFQVRSHSQKYFKKNGVPNNLPVPNKSRKNSEQMVINETDNVKIQQLSNDLRLYLDDIIKENDYQTQLTINDKLSKIKEVVCPNNLKKTTRLRLPEIGSEVIVRQSDEMATTINPAFVTMYL